MTSLGIIFGTLYFWAGFLKLTSLDFYDSVAPRVFAPLFAVLRCVIPLPHSYQYALSAGGVAAEMMMGAVILFRCHFPRHWLLVVSIFNIFFHLYIIIFVGWCNGVHTFISWNCMCMAVSVLLLTAQPPTLVTGNFEMAGFYWHHAVLALLLWLPPAMLLVGLCPYPTLAHAWFVPHAESDSTLLFPVHCLHHMPEEESGHPLTYRCCDAAALDAAAELVGGHAALAGALGVTLPPLDKSVAQVRVVLLRSVLCVDDSWLDATFRLHHYRHDPCNEQFGAGAPAFWRQVCDTTLLCQLASYL
jgi:hypothetical protein